MKRATTKQIKFIEQLIDSRECSELLTNPVINAIHRGHGEDVTVKQASEAIDLLLACPEPGAFREGSYVIHPKYGRCEVIDSTPDMSRVDDGHGLKVIDNAMLTQA